MSWGRVRPPRPRGVPAPFPEGSRSLSVLAMFDGRRPLWALTGWLIRRHLRQRRLALVPVGLVVALGATAALAAAGAADRTAGAYDRYLDRADVGDVVVNPSLATRQIDEVIRDLPGVRSVTSDAFLFAGIDRSGGEPRTAQELDDMPLQQVRGSTDGRYVAMDRPAMDAGRLPTGRDEVLVSKELAEAEGVGVGDTLPVSFWGRRPGSDLHPALVEGDDVATVLFAPLGVEHLTVVGIGVLSDEVLPDGLYPRGRIILDPATTARYDCLPDAPAQDADATEIFDVQAPEGCAVSYRYYSLDVEGGADQVSSVVDALLERADALSAQLPQALSNDEGGGGYLPIVTTTAQEGERIERSVQPTVAALWVLSGVAAAVTVVVAGLAIARELRRSEDDLAQWRQLGLTAGERMRVVVLPLLATVAGGLLVALAAAWLLSPIGPVGSVRSVDPSPARELPVGVAVGLVALALVLSVATVLLAHRGAERAGRTTPASHRRPSALQRLVGRSARPELTEGVRAAGAGHRGAGLVMASGGLAAGIFLAAVVFGASLSAVVSTPASYGWPWDVATMGGAGYGSTDIASVDGSLDARADVASWTVLGFTSLVAIDGEPVMSVVGFDRSSTVDLPLVDGRLPSAADEVALGARTAADHGVGVGERVGLTAPGLRFDATVTGLVVLPPLGPYLSDRAAPGTGMLLPEAMIPADEAAGLASFVGIDLVDGTDARPVAGELGDDFQAWSTDGSTFDYADAVRPPEIVDADRMRAVPLLAGALLVLAAVIGLALAVVVSVRGRRRELAVLRALGFTGRQLRTSVRVQAVVTMAVALACGIPVGIALGRVAWRAFADQLGVAAGPVVPLGLDRGHRRRRAGRRAGGRGGPRPHGGAGRSRDRAEVRVTGAVAWLTRRHLRQRWPGLVPLALIVAAGATGALVAAGAAERTAGAYDRYLERAEVSDVVVNPSLRTEQIDRAVARASRACAA